jgi:alpha-D-xyloside xylohydrolase
MNGYWMTSADYAAQPYEIWSGDGELYVHATTQVIRHRGMTLGGPNLTLTFSSPMRDVVKVSVTHFKGAVKRGPQFELNRDDNFRPVITEDAESAALTSGGLSLRIKKGEAWDLSYSYNGRRLTGAGWRSTGYAKQGPARKQEYFFDQPDNNGAYIIERLDLDVGECVYGFGEKFTSFVKNGQTVDIWNSDGGTCTDQSYKSVPFYLSSKGYGVLVNDPGGVSFEVGSEVVSKVSFSVPGEQLEYFIIGGANLKEVLSNYTALTGQPALPPAYSFGLWLSTSFTTDYNEETVNSFIDGMADRDIPLSVFHFDCFWMKEFEWCGFEWDTRQFPKPERMLERLKEKGLELCVWINPYVGQRSSLFDEGAENGYFIKNRDGSVFQADLWQPGLAIVDFTNPAACEWYAACLTKLFAMGIRNIKTDFGERIPTDVVYYGGQDPVRMHNYYSYLYNKTVADAAEQFFGKNASCLFARSATVGGQKFPVHWGGDPFASYSAMAETLRAGLSLCASGFGFYSHDISGFESTATPDLYKRWCAFGLMSTHSRLHGSSSYRVPWLFDEEAVEVLRFYTKLKGRLMPYLYSQAVRTHLTGVPMMRPMILEFPDDPVCKYLDTQYMLGDSLLIAPVFNAEGAAEFYLPDGVWTDIVSGEVYDGGRYVKRACSYTGMPVLAREGAVIGFGDYKKSAAYDYVNGTEFIVYGLKDGAETSAEVYDCNGGKALTLTVRRAGDGLNVTASPNGGGFTVRMA